MDFLRALAHCLEHSTGIAGTYEPESPGWAQVIVTMPERRAVMVTTHDGDGWDMGIYPSREAWDAVYRDDKNVVYIRLECGSEIEPQVQAKVIEAVGRVLLGSQVRA